MRSNSKSFAGRHASGPRNRCASVIARRQLAFEEPTAVAFCRLLPETRRRAPSWTPIGNRLSVATRALVAAARHRRSRAADSSPLGRETALPPGPGVQGREPAPTGRARFANKPVIQWSFFAPYHKLEPLYRLCVNRDPPP